LIRFSKERLTSCLALKINDVQQDLTCSCDVKFRLFSFGININLECDNNVDICLDDANMYCGKMKLVTQVYRKVVTSKSAIVFDAKPIAGVGLGGVNIDPGPLVVNITHASPIKLSDPISFQSCNASIDQKPCRSCEICESKKEVKFNCQNVNFDTLYYAPAFNKCIGMTDED
jgi:hypothetical protein